MIEDVEQLTLELEGNSVTKMELPAQREVHLK